MHGHSVIAVTRAGDFTNLAGLNPILYMAGHGSKWRGLGGRLGNWHPICTRMKRWSRRVVLGTFSETLQRADRRQPHRGRILGLDDPTTLTGASGRKRHAGTDFVNADSASHGRRHIPCDPWFVKTKVLE